MKIMPEKIVEIKIGSANSPCDELYIKASMNALSDLYQIISKILVPPYQPAIISPAKPVEEPLEIQALRMNLEIERLKLDNERDLKLKIEENKIRMLIALKKAEMAQVQRAEEIARKTK